MRDGGSTVANNEGEKRVPGGARTCRLRFPFGFLVKPHHNHGHCPMRLTAFGLAGRSYIDPRRQLTQPVTTENLRCSANVLLHSILNLFSKHSFSAGRFVRPAAGGVITTLLILLSGRAFTTSQPTADVNNGRGHRRLCSHDPDLLDS